MFVNYFLEFTVSDFSNIDNVNFCNILNNNSLCKANYDLIAINNGLHKNVTKYFFLKKETN